MAIDAVSEEVWNKCVKEITQEIARQRGAPLVNDEDKQNAEKIMHKVYNILRGFR